MSATSCWTSGAFSVYFGENMDGLGMDYPKSWFSTQEKAISLAAAMLAAVKVLGTRATLAELLGATFVAEKVMVVGVVSASGYVGAVIGSIAVSMGRMAGCGSRLADAVERLARVRLNDPLVTRHLVAHPEILDGRSGRSSPPKVAILLPPSARLKDAHHA